MTLFLCTAGTVVAGRGPDGWRSRASISNGLTTISWRPRCLVGDGASGRSSPTVTELDDFVDGRREVRGQRKVRELEKDLATMKSRLNCLHLQFFSNTLQTAQVTRER